MTDLIPFTYGDRPVRTVQIDGEPWFVAADVCAVLGIGRVNDATTGLDEDEKGAATIRTPGGDQQMATVNEPGLYSLILRSRKAEAKAFKRWITHEVLPALRNTGTYSVAKLGRRELAQMVIEAEDRAVAAEATVAELEPAAHSWEQLASAEGDYALREAAQILSRAGIETGQNRLMASLRDFGWVDRTGTPYQKHVDQLLICLRAASYTHPYKDEPQLKYQIRLTAKGIHKLHTLLGGPRPLVFSIPTEAA